MKKQFNLIIRIPHMETIYTDNIKDMTYEHLSKLIRSFYMDSTYTQSHEFIVDGNVVVIGSASLKLAVITINTYEE